jgi:hypothetical protein
MTTQQEPAFTAFAVSKRGDDQDDWWTPIGAAFPHKDSLGPIRPLIMRAHLEQLQEGTKSISRSAIVPKDNTGRPRRDDSVGTRFRLLPAGRAPSGAGRYIDEPCWISMKGEGDE